jgi:hypothetical protein
VALDGLIFIMKVVSGVEVTNKSPPGLLHHLGSYY